MKDSIVLNAFTFASKHIQEYIKNDGIERAKEIFTRRQIDYGYEAALNDINPHIRWINLAINTAFGK